MVIIMTDFQHSIVLFSGEDGLPLEFNVRNTDGKALLKALIEHGGGLCSQSESAVHLITPGTKVLNADLGKTLVSAQYIFDCVKQNYLLDVNDYVFTISEARTSDISDEESENIIAKKQVEVPIVNFSDNLEVIDMDIDETLLSSHPVKEKITITVAPSEAQQKEMPQNLTSSNNTSESFIEGSVGVDSFFKISSMPSKTAFSPEYTSTAKDALMENSQKNARDGSDEFSPIKGSHSLVSPLKTNNIFSSDDLKLIVQSQKVNFVERDENPSPIHTVVSSSQSIAEFDDFDNALLSKAQHKLQSDEEEEGLSQSYTVSSSADAQVASKPNSEEIFAGGSSAIPDSPMQNENLVKEQQAYLKELETEVENVLKKPSPKSIQDKICLVKYLCCTMKLPPAKVLEMLPRL